MTERLILKVPVVEAGGSDRSLYGLPVLREDMPIVAQAALEAMTPEQIRELLRTHFAEYLIVEVRP